MLFYLSEVDFGKGISNLSTNFKHFKLEGANYDADLRGENLLKMFLIVCRSRFNIELNILILNIKDASIFNLATKDSQTI